MRSVLSLGVAALLLLQLPATADDLVVGLFERYIEALRRQAGIPGLSAAIVGQDAILWERGFGLQDVDRSIAARPDTPYPIDGITQVFTAAMTLRCAEENRLSLDVRIGQFDSDAPDPNATILQVLTHTSGSGAGLAYDYSLDRFPPLTRAIRTCTIGSYRKSLGELFDRLAMRDSVPGPDVLRLVPPAEGIPDPPTSARYRAILERLATPYAVDRRNGRASPTTHPVTELTPALGIISSVRDLAQFDLALRKGVLLRPETVDAAWRNPLSAEGQPLPHGIGWFVQTYKGERVVWQFGIAENASSSLIVTVPARNVTLIMLANSDGLVSSFAPEEGDLSISPFGRLFLRFFIG
ncbi:MAG TPA: serine hydrolase domain-containing protein [Vicinamibacterales bacterium]|nr:serine hydrolase domain-containing protein [Vicinamibacterales bacterium]